MIVVVPGDYSYGGGSEGTAVVGIERKSKSMRYRSTEKKLLTPKWPNSGCDDFAEMVHVNFERVGAKIETFFFLMLDEENS